MRALADAAELRQLFGSFPSGVVAVAAEIDGKGQVMVASSFTVGVSAEPPLVMFAVQHTSASWPRLADANRIGISVLAIEHAEKLRQLAAKESDDRLLGIGHTVWPSGALTLSDCPAVMECSIQHTYPAGDHDIIVLQVHAADSDAAFDPMIWHRSGVVAIAG